MSQHIQEAIDLLDTLLSYQSNGTPLSQPSKAQPKDSGACQPLQFCSGSMLAA